MTTTTTPGIVKDVDPQTLSDWLGAGQALVVDVRPPEMFAAERIPGALSLPLPTLGRSTTRPLWPRQNTILIVRRIALSNFYLWTRGARRKARCSTTRNRNTRSRLIRVVAGRR